MNRSNKNVYLENRRYLIYGAVILLMVVYVGRLFYLQVMDNDYKDRAESNAFLKRTILPSRGIIYDRNGELLVYNQPAYDVMITMREVQAFDTLDFCNTVGITLEQYHNRIAEIRNKKLNPGYSPYVPQTFMNHLSTRDYGVLQEKLYKFPGFHVQNRPIREYERHYAAHILGNTGEVNPMDIKNDAYYVRGDYSGRSGAEKSYEAHLRGEKGVNILLRDAHGRVKGSYEDGAHDVEAVAGKNLKLAIDIELQAYGEKLMQNKRGSIVMIEPETGEILCMVSAPSYDPALLVGRQRGANHKMLELDKHKPLLDRAIMGTYPPGSTFKPTQGLIFQQEGVITPNTMYTCAHGYTFRGGKPACHGHPSPLGLVSAIATSCNSYFCWGLHDMLDKRTRYPSVQVAFDVWKDHMVSMGYGYQLGVDIPGEMRGYIPNSTVYDNIYNKRWNSSTVISIAIGQGEILATPLQIANLAATIANRGYYIVPHVVKEIQDTPLDEKYTQRKYTSVKQEHYLPIVEGMRGAVTEGIGTCKRFNIPGIEVCAKTGTAENPHGKDHSACMAFAPKDKPKVAIAVYVENGGFGANFAVPIGRLMFEKFFYGEILPESKWTEESMLNAVILPDNVI